MDKISTQETVFLAVASILEEAIRLGQYDKARVCLSVLDVIRQKREARKP